jgi:threonine aldolase
MTISTSSDPPAMPVKASRFELPETRLNVDRDIFSQVKSTAAATRDLRSDTITTPTENMYRAMREAGGGDNIYLEDITSMQFEADVAALCGKEAGLYVPSGTLSNQLCLRTWLQQPPFSVMCDRRSHIHRYEAGGVSYHSGAAVELVIPSNGRYLRWEEDIKPNLALDHDDTHSAPTAIVSLENTLNGTIFPQDEIVKIKEGLKPLGIKLHLDGARLWNVSAKTGLSMEELCRPFDSVSLCFSKGLGAPIGSMLIGPAPFVKKALHFRKMFGAGLRQAGILTAAARVALTEHFHKLQYTHDLAQWLAEEVKRLGAVIPIPVDTSMVSLQYSWEKGRRKVCPFFADPFYHRLITWP